MKAGMSFRMLWIPLIYALLAGLWIGLSDWLLLRFVSDPRQLTLWQGYKGWGFVIFTALLLFAFLRWQTDQLNTVLKEYQRTAQTLRESETRYRLLVDSSPFAIAVHQNGKLVFVNNAALTLMRATQPEQLLGLPIANIVHPDGWQEARERIGRMLQGETGLYPVDDRYVRLDGSVVSVQVTAAPFVFEGQPAVQVIALDISARDSALKNLQASEARFRRAIDDSPFPIVIHAEDGEVLALSQTWCEITGYSARELPTIAAWTALAYRHLPAVTPVQAGIEQLYNMDRRVDEGEFTISCKDGSIRVWDFSSSPLGHLPDGRRTVISMAADVTERKRLEEETRRLNADLELLVARRTKQLEVRNQELETFTYSVSHDLKAPLRGIDGYSRLLQEEYSDKLDDEGRRFLATIRRATLQMNELIEDLLAYSRLERRPLNPGTIHLPGLVDGLLAELADDIRQRAVTVSVNVPDITVSADPDGLAMALRNLLDNAIKFSGDTPQPVIDVSGRFTGETVILQVSDNGIGFDEKFKVRIFEIFQRLHRAEDYPGTGVGLALVKKAMDRMGGRAWATGRPNEGATFYLEIPKKGSDEQNIKTNSAD